MTRWVLCLLQATTFPAATFLGSSRQRVERSLSDGKFAAFDDEGTLWAGIIAVHEGERDTDTEPENSCWRETKVIK